MSSELRVNILRGSTANGNITIQGEGASNLGGATMQLQQSLAKAWARWDSSGNDGSGDTTLGDSFGVSTLSDDNTGKNIVNLTNAMINTNYAALGLAQFQDSNGLTIAEGPSGVTTSSYRISTRSATNQLYDSDFVSNALFGDLA